PKDMLPAKRFGTRTSVITTATGTTATKIGGMSRSVLCGAPVSSPALSCLSPLITAENDLHIVGNARATATIPAAATAPAPMKRTCFDQICAAVSDAIGPVP